MIKVIITLLSNYKFVGYFVVMVLVNIFYVKHNLLALSKGYLLLFTIKLSKTRSETK